jgi:hypothetical protein
MLANYEIKILCNYDGFNCFHHGNNGAGHRKPISVCQVRRAIQRERKIIDETGGFSDQQGWISDTLHRVADETAPPVPVFSVIDGQGKVTIAIDTERSESENEDDMQEYIVSRATEFDSSDTPLDAEEVGRFSKGTLYKDIAQDEGTSAKYALQAQDNYGNTSAYSSWFWGISLRETGVQDRFDEYGGNQQVTNDGDLFWLQIARMEEDEAWTSTNVNPIVFDSAADRVIEGRTSVKVTSSGGATAIGIQLDISSYDLSNDGRFTDDDYVTFSVFSSRVLDADIGIDFSPSTLPTTNRLRHTGTAKPGWNHFIFKRGDFTTSGTATWANVVYVRIFNITTLTAGDVLQFDTIHLVKASPSDSTTFSYTGDLWQPLPDDNLGATSGQWKIFKDAPDGGFALAQIIHPRDSSDRYIIVREDREIDNATHACAIEIKDVNGQGGMLFRVQRPESPFVMETPEINVMFTNSSVETVGQTHTPTSSGVTIGDTSTRGGYAEFGSTDELSYASVTLSNSRNEFTAHVSFRADFNATDAGDKVLWQHYIDANNQMRLKYNATSDTFTLTSTIGGVSQSAAETAVQTFTSGTIITLTVTVDDTTLKLFKNGDEKDEITLTANYSTSSGTLYVSNNNASGNDFIGRIFQLFINHEVDTETEILAWTLSLSAPENVTKKVASPDQRSYYSFELDTNSDEVTLFEHRIGFTPSAIASAVSFISSSDAIYNLAVIVENQDNDNDGDSDQLLIRAYISADSGKLLDGDSQVFAETLTEAADYPWYSGFVGFSSDNSELVRFINFRAGSPQRAEEAERAVWAREAGRLTVPDLSITSGRLTLTSGTPVTTADVTAATTVYFAPYKGNKITLHDGKGTWNDFSFTELSVSVPSTTTTPFDIFIYDAAGTLTLETLDWTNDTTRATALTWQDGVYVLSGDSTRRYLGTGRTTGVSGQTEKSQTYMGLWNYYNRVATRLRVNDATSHTYTTASWRSWNNDNTIRVEVVRGVNEGTYHLMLHTRLDFDSGDAQGRASIGENTTTGTSLFRPIIINDVGEALGYTASGAFLSNEGYDYYQIVEYGGSPSIGFVTAYIEGWMLA